MSDPLSELLAQVLGAFLQSVFERVFTGTRGWSQHRKLARQLVSPDALLRRIEPEIAALRGSELAGLTDAEWAAAVGSVRDALAAVVPIELPAGYRLLRDPAALRAHVGSGAAGVLAAAGLNEDGERARDLLLTGCCTALVASAAASPELSALVRSLALNDVQDALARAERLLIELHGGPRLAAAAFEQRYLGFLAGTKDTFELFGVSSGRAPARQSYDDFYVSLALTRRDEDTAHRQLTGAGTDGAHAVADVHKVLVQGGAGAGKTTFLNRLRLVAARGGQQWPDVVPFVVPLRRFAGRAMPGLEELVGIDAAALAGEKPPHWVSGVFSDGRGLLLVDGLDELAPDDRQFAMDWLAELMAAYPRSRYLVSSRPSAADEHWVRSCGLVPFDLLPLSDDGVRDFVRNWHSAARDREQDRDEQDWLTATETALLGTLSARPELHRLASSPLLCGLICALHRKRGMTLPGDRRGLLDAALDLLLVRWDQQRGLPAAGPEQQLFLLQRFAYSMVVNDEVVLPRDMAEARFRHAARGLGAQQPPAAELLQVALERSGLLREPDPDRIQFVHRTFRDFLAARELVEAGLIGQLVEHAEDDAWREVVVMAVAQARPKERADILERLLDKAAALRRKDSGGGDRLELVAAVCLAEVQVIDPEQVRDRVREAVRRLIPPAGFPDAEALARAGSFVLDLLPGPDGLTDEQAALVVHTAARIGGAGAWAKIKPFVKRDNDMVINELLAGWRHVTDAEEYAREVLAEVDFGDRPVPVRRWDRMVALRHLKLLTSVKLIGMLRPLDPLADIAGLRTLQITANELLSELGPLARCDRLTELELLMCGSLTDLSPLRDSPVRSLSLHGVGRADLGTLTGTGLRRLRIRHPELARGLHALPAGLPLTELHLDNRPEDRSLRGIDRWPGLRRAGLASPPRPDEVPLLAALPTLTELMVDRADPVTELAPLDREWPALRTLILRGVSTLDLIAARKLLSGADFEVRAFRPADDAPWPEADA